MKKLSLLQKIFSLIGFIGILMLLPGLFYAAGWEGPVNFLENIAPWGDRSLMTVIAFILMGLMFLFGGGHNVSATFVGYLIGFFLISTAVEISFMGWFRNWAAGIGFLSVPPLNYIVGIITVSSGILMSFNHRIPLFAELAALVILPIVFLVTTDQMNWLRLENQDFEISVDAGMQKLGKMIDKKYLKLPSVKQYLQKVEEDESLEEGEKEAKIKELQERISRMEEDQQTIEELKKQNEEYAKQMAQQRKNLKDFSWCASSKESSKMVKRIAEAVVPGQPCVRDFAVSLVKTESGPYYDYQRGLPGRNGIKQICALHMHLSSHWSYVNDPTVLRDDFYSPADRTIAVDLAGDCDDFAALTASCIESIGGVSRIMVGRCSGGGHAWAEVLIGSQSDWDRAVKAIRSYYNKPNMTINGLKDAQGLHWLCLDWKMGQYSCNDSGTQCWYTSKEQKTKKY